MPTMPTSASCWNRRAAWPERVKIAAPLAYGLALISAMASASESDAHHAQHRPEDLLAVDRHRRRHAVEQRRARRRSRSRGPAPPAARPSTTSVAPSSTPRSISPTMRSRAAQVITGPISMSSRVAGPDRHVRARARELLDQRVAGVAHGHDRRDRHAALARRTVARADDRVGGEIEIRVGHHHRVVLGAAQRLHALAVRARRSRRCSCAIGVEPTNDTALIVRMRAGSRRPLPCRRARR